MELFVSRSWGTSGNETSETRTTACQKRSNKSYSSSRAKLTRYCGLFLKLAAIFVVLGELTGCGHRTAPPDVPLTLAAFRPLQNTLRKPYLQLFREADSYEFSANQIDQMRKFLDDAQDYCVGQFENKIKDLNQQIERDQSELEGQSSHLNEGDRHRLHCSIQNSRIRKSQDQALADHAIPVAYENKKAKLQLIEDWPQNEREIKRAIESGTYHNREHGDVRDIGFREVGEGQQEDIDDGQEAIDRMRRSDMLPPEIDNKYIRDYLTDLAEKVAAKSDLKIPVKVTGLNSKEINAFALPGGFLFVQRGLLEEAEDEGQLIGVISHEIAHAAARHGHQLMQRATVAQIIYQAAQVAAVVLTGGAAGIGTYYALRYGFLGLGLVLNLDLLGVSRDFELEADQLGIQYSWNAGYDPNGFIRFFDKMATKEGYVNGTSWFRTHPPFYERMKQSMREIEFLPKKANLRTNSPAFERMKRELKAVTAKAKEEEEGRPSLKAPEEGCEPPSKTEYEAGQPIETICSVPGVS